LNHCFYDDLLSGLGVSSVQFLEGLLGAGASTWGGVEDAHILEEGGVPVASAFGFVPNPEKPMPVDLQRIDQVAAELGWAADQAEEFRIRYSAFSPTQDGLDIMKPHADYILEYVAVVPEARGRGLIKILMQTMLAQAKARGLSTAGIMIINGNDHAAHVYETLGFKPYCTYYEEFFADTMPGFPGLTRYRLRFERH
jgi:GNAT superfamily N-acetyltransferase